LKILHVGFADNPPVIALPIYNYQNCVVSVDGVARDFALINNGIGEDSLLQIEVDLIGTDPLGAPFVIPFTMPGYIDTPIVKHANGQPTTDERYLLTTVTAGHFIMKGRLPSGDWKLTQSRINAALKQINAPFEVNTPTLTFLVSTPV
jgi:hypothetical protein